MTQEHINTIVRLTPAGGTHIYFVYDDMPTVQEAFKTIQAAAEINTNIMIRVKNLVSSAKKNTKLITSLVPSLEEAIRGGMSSNMYVRNGWSGI
jgi:hypothetical protein